MHIELTKDNKSKILDAAGRLELSAGEIVNRIISSVESIEIEQVIKFSPTPNAEEKKASPIIKRKPFSIRVRL